MRERVRTVLCDPVIIIIIIIVVVVVVAVAVVVVIVAVSDDVDGNLAVSGFVLLSKTSWKGVKNFGRKRSQIGHQ